MIRNRTSLYRDMDSSTLRFINEIHHEIHYSILCMNDFVLKLFAIETSLLYQHLDFNLIIN